ncbi:hypothetical protein [Ruminiclostridium cellobioparum]|nr:hypothetical protein [Ruminiclostridium cellobioparum]
MSFKRDRFVLVTLFMFHDILNLYGWNFSLNVGQSAVTGFCFNNFSSEM